MIGRDIVKLLEIEAKRRPNIAELLARAETLTDEEIDTAQVPLKWFKDALKEARKRQLGASAERRMAELLATLPPMESNNDGENEKRGLTLEYTGGNFWTKTRTGAEMEICTGDWFFFPEDGSGAWLNQTFLPRPPMQLSQSKQIAEQTRFEYVLAYKAKLNNMPGFQQPEHTLDELGDSKPMFRIYKTPGNYW